MSAAPRKQHVISRVVLRQFSDPATRTLAAFDLRSGRTRRLAPAAVGYVDRFIRAADADAAERRWQAMEQRLPRALRAVEDRSLFSSPSDVDTIRECLAIHWGRSRTVLEVDRRNRRPAADQARRDMVQAQPQVFRAEFLRRRGRPPEGPDDVHALAEEMLPYDEGMMERLFTDTVHENVDEALARLQHEPIEIVAATGATEFLIGDIPALTLGASDGGGPLDGVPWEDAQTLVLPLGPKTLVAVGGSGGYHDVDDRAVTELNTRQVRAALERILYRPGADLDALIVAARGIPTADPRR